jgi:bacterioferritin-associated ferredoxin
MVDRCVCYERKFEDIKKQMEDLKINDIESLRKIIPFGLNCGLCIPYIQLMIKTGRTKFYPDEINIDPIK